ncbi:MAG: hypothetical protein JO247_13220 [Chloroflexi bacterium]|nr:hypothetical protein [Chloroflexota bacterium]
MALPAPLAFPAEAGVAPETAERPMRSRPNVHAPAWLPSFRTIGRKLGHWLAFAAILTVFFVLIIAVMGELGWFLGWASGEVAKTFITHDFSPHDMGADFGSAWSGQVSALSSLAHTIGQISRRALTGL